MSSLKERRRYSNIIRHEFEYYRLQMIVVLSIATLFLAIIFTIGLFNIKQTDVDYITKNELSAQAASQLAFSIGDNYAWYDYDRRSGRVYLLVRSNGEIVSVSEAYGPTHNPLYVSDLKIAE